MDNAKNTCDANSISVITATYNAAKLLPRLVASLQSQTDQDFEWVVADGGSTDATLDQLSAASINLHKVVVSSQSDFGIYDALNRGIKISSSEYYLVLGADDILEKSAIANYKKAIAETGADLITAHLYSTGEARPQRDRKKPWLHGAFAYVSGHAVGLAVKRSLHKKVGYYSNKLPIAADQLFILKAIKCGASVNAQNFVAGNYESLEGLSGQDVLGSLLEGYRAQMATGQSKWVQTVLLILRLIKNWRNLERGLKC